MQNQKCKSLNKYTLFYKQHFYKQHQAEIGKKNVKQTLSNTLKLHFWYFKIIHILHPCHHPEIIGHILKTTQKNKYVCIHEVIRLIIMKMKIKMRNRSHRYHISRPRSRQGHNYSKYKVSQYDDACMYWLIPKQHLKLNSWKVSATLRLSWKKHCL